MELNKVGCGYSRARITARWVGHTLMISLTSDDYDIELLHKYAQAFPDSAMTTFILSYLAWAHRELPELAEPEEAEADPTAETVKSKQGKGRRLMNARERRKAKRKVQGAAKNEDLEREEREEVFAMMVVRGLVRSC
jgi:hypothetical protein